MEVGNKVMFSVVTVCYNAENTIRQTIKSVLNQTYLNYEYIIQDGFSDDLTLNIAQSYINKFQDKEISYSIISEKDNGIYNAMNKAIEKCSGDWIIFMNSDDQFFSAEVLAKAADFLRTVKCDVLYGNSISIYSDRKKVRENHSAERLKKKMSLCHQACFIRSDLMKKYMYNEKYKIGADYDFFLNVMTDGGKFEKINEVICNYSRKGISNRNIVESYLEFLDIHKNHGIKERSKIIVMAKLFRKRILMKKWEHG